MTSLRPDARVVSAFFSRKPSTKGPFQTERAKVSALLLLADATAAQDHAVGLLVVPGLLALGGLAPGGDRMPPARGAAFAAAMRVVDGIHGHAAHGGLAALPTVAAGLADADVLLIGIGNRPDRRHALGAHHAHLARGHAQQRQARVAADQLDIGAGSAGHLAAAARL